MEHDRSTVATLTGTNGTYIYQTVYPNQVSSNVWMIVNYTELYQ